MVFHGYEYDYDSYRQVTVLFHFQHDIWHCKWIPTRIKCASHPAQLNVSLCASGSL
jgi:hypothetical protein